MYSDKNILVTGGTGMIGSHLVELLLEKNANVRFVDLKREIPPELEDRGLDVVSGD